jgi:hypothetical protein
MLFWCMYGSNMIQMLMARTKALTIFHRVLVKIGYYVYKKLIDNDPVQAMEPKIVCQMMPVFITVLQILV